MASSEAILQKAADNGSLETDEWPNALQYILDRLDEIVNEFPKTAASTDPLSASNANTPSQPQNAISSQESETADKENAPPATPPRPPVPTFTDTLSANPDLPQETLNFYTSIRTQLTKNFSKNPPHTIQRLAELVLQPKRHYRFLPSYLRALDRIVSVSSPTTIFPLPQAILPNTSGLLNGTTTPQPQSTLGSDESLGGALLTPIPWLQNRGSNSELISESTEIVEGPNGAGRIETVTVMSGAPGTSGTTSTTSPTSTAAAPQPQQHQAQQIASSHPDGETLPYTGAVTQGELLRQEQEAGVVLSNPHSVNPHRTVISEMEHNTNTGIGAAGAGSLGTGAQVVDTVEEEEAPHARGPEVIGMEDTGPQPIAGATLDIEGAVGRPSIDRASKSPGPSSVATDTKAEGEAEVEMEDAADKTTADDAEKEGGEDKDEDMKTDA